MRFAHPVFALAALTAAVGPPAAAQAQGKPHVEVVFVIDTTGSMQKTLDAMRTRIFGIWSQILTGEPRPHVRVGVVAYRDKKDDYVTQVTDLSEYPDAVYRTLKGLKAGGGGDTPEHVNQGLDDAVNKISWSEDKKGGLKRTLRMIFVMGDAEPHMDYDDVVKYPETCKAAAKKGIVINTVACGGSDAAKKAFDDIAKQGKGSHFVTDANGGDPLPETKHDKRLAAIHDELVKSYLPHGAKEAQEKQLKHWAELAGLKGPEAVDRAVLEARLGVLTGEPDLVDAARRGRVAVVAMPADHLPTALLGTTGEELEKTVADLWKKREKLYKEAVDLGARRTAVHRANPQAKASFDGLIRQLLRTQGNKFGIRY
jgi:Mg-chelatase subunit ChlD